MTPGPLDMIESVRAHHRAYERGDWEAALAVAAPDVEFEWVQAGPAAGTYHGHEGIASPMAEWIRAWERGSIRIRLDRLIVSGTTLTVHGAHLARGRSSGVEVSLPVAQVWEFGDEGLVTRIVTGEAEAVDTRLPAYVEAMVAAEEARLRGDAEGALAIFADDVVFHGLDHGPLAGPHHGPAGVLYFFSEWLSAFEEHESRVQLMIDLGDRVITEAPQRGRSRGVEVEMISRGSWWFRDGKVVLVRWFDSLEEALRHTEAPLP